MWKKELLQGKWGIENSGTIYLVDSVREIWAGRGGHFLFKQVEGKGVMPVLRFGSLFLNEVI